MTPEEARANIGRKVVYRRHAELPPEEGVIVSADGDSWVFVRYGSDGHAKATHYSHLELAVGGVS